MTCAYDHIYNLYYRSNSVGNQTKIGVTNCSNDEPFLPGIVGLAIVTRPIIHESNKPLNKTVVVALHAHL